MSEADSRSEPSDVVAKTVTHRPLGVSDLPKHATWRHRPTMRKGEYDVRH